MIEAVEAKMQELVASVNYPYAAELFGRLSGGKRLRARLVLAISDGGDAAILLAAIFELIHGASLLHDDVIDEAQTRRGVPSVNATEGSKLAVMLGDILYSKSFSELVAFETAIAKGVADAVTALSVGEMMDVKMAEAFNADESLYLTMLYNKTAVLIEAAAKTAAILAGKDAEAYGLYGKNLGLAFQVIDDVLDIVSDEATLGKPAMNDYVEGKCTLPYIHLYRALGETDREKLVAMHARALSPEELTWIRTQMAAHGAIDASRALAKRLSEEAITAIRGDAALEAMAQKMLSRVA